MRTITYQAAEREDQTVSAFLMMVLDYGQEIGMFGLLGRKVKAEMKQVRYSLVNKAQTVMASLVMGCGHTTQNLGCYQQILIPCDFIVGDITLSVNRDPIQAKVNFVRPQPALPVQISKTGSQSG